MYARVPHAMAQFVLKIVKLSHITDTAKTLEMARALSDSLRRRANARNVSFQISLRWPIHSIDSVDKTKLSCNTPHRRSITVSLETYPLYKHVMSANNSKTKCRIFAVVANVLQNTQNLVILLLPRTATKCTKIHNARA